MNSICLRFGLLARNEVGQVKPKSLRLEARIKQAKYEEYSSITFPLRVGDLH